MELEQGQEVKIPSTLCQQSLPRSFRYYDPIVKIVQTLVSLAKKKYLIMQMHLVRQFDKQYSLKGLIGLGSKKEDQKEKKNDLVVKCEINPLAGFEMDLDYNNSLHT